MKRLLTLALVLFLPLATPALALEQASPPAKFPVPWANSAGTAYVRSIPTVSQIGIQNCAASLTDGFPPLTFVPANAGGCPPFGQDFNGILKQLTQWSQWGQAGGPVFYDSAFASAVNGYPKGAILMSAVVPGTLWMSTADDNTTNPDADGANWVRAPGQVPLGTPVQAISTLVPAGYVAANGLTIGDASSNATNRANADTVFLFTFIWNNCPTAQCPIFTSGGASSSRGANAAADYAAHKAMAVWNMKGLGLMGVDTMGGAPSAFLAGVPIASGEPIAPSSILGENLHVLSAGEAPTITSANAAQGIHVAGTTTVSGTVNGTIVVSGTVDVAGDVGAGGRLIPTSSSAITNLQAAGAATTNIAPANSNGNWAGAATLAGTMTGVNSMSGDNSMSGSMSGSNAMAADNAISVTSNNTGGGGHNTVERSILVYWNLKL